MSCVWSSPDCILSLLYAKSGDPIDIHSKLPTSLIEFEPDWHKADVTGAREPVYYDIELKQPGRAHLKFHHRKPGGNCTRRRRNFLRPGPRAARQRLLNKDDAETLESGSGFAEELHANYVPEMRCICAIAPDVRLKEKEVVLGMILAFCTQSRWHASRSWSDEVLHAEGLIIQGKGPPTESRLRAGWLRAWAVGVWAQHHRDLEFIESFSLIMFGIILSIMMGLPEPWSEVKDDRLERRTMCNQETLSCEWGWAQSECKRDLYKI
ncbi:hypothetical protein BJV74DRAFT_923087 [Russula compacta]|nr:hypothetical protein BJV74DRAFT_923087 [Russula compacta]